MVKPIIQPTETIRASVLTAGCCTALIILLTLLSAMNPSKTAASQTLSTPEGCPTFPAVVSNETELNNAITCYNHQTAPAAYTITLTAEIKLTTPTIPINNATPDVELILNGAGHSINGQSIPGVRPFFVAPSTEVTMRSITITGGLITGPTNNQGGAIYNQGTLTIEQSRIENNSAVTGGAIHNDAHLLIYSSAFVKNSTTESGGAIYTTGGQFYISDSLFQYNQSGADAGAIFAANPINYIGYTTFLSNTAQGNGGALVTTNTLSMAASTFKGNTAVKNGGALEVNALATLGDSTISGNTAGFGGGIAVVDNGVLNFNHVTMSGNTAVTATGGLSLTKGSFAYILSSIIANSKGADCAGPGIFTDLRHNLIEDGGCIYDNTSISGDPKLGPLADNGSFPHLIFPTLTHALLPGSPAIDHVPTGQNACGSAGNQDQRGITRPQGSGCDIGSFEAAIFPLTVSTVGSGIVIGPGINCGVDCTENFYENSPITLTATPESGFLFSGWSGDCSGTADCPLIIIAPKTVTATFTEIDSQIFLPIMLEQPVTYRPTTP